MVPERNLFFFVVILGLEITYLLISYFVGKKKLICVCIAKHEGKEAKMYVVDQFSSSVSNGSCLFLFSLNDAWIPG